MRLLIPLFLVVPLGSCLVTSLGAQEVEVKQPQPADLGVINDVDVTVTDLTEEKLNNPPKREIKFEHLKEPAKQKLPKADPKLFEQKYVATFRLEVPTTGPRYANSIHNNDGETAKLQFLGRSFLIFPQAQGDGGSLSESFARMSKGLPADVAHSQEERELLTKPEGIVEMLTITAAPGTARSRSWSFTLLGTTPEQIELRSKALLILLDQGACRPIQLAIFKKREPLCVQLRDQRKAVEKTQRTMNVVEDAMKSYVDFTPDMLPNLRVQQLQLDVDLAGVKARIAACERLLAGAALKPERRSQVEDLKVAAEIEFSGFEARRTKSEEFINKVKTKTDLHSKLFAAQSRLTNDRQVVENTEQQIRNLDAAIRAYAPLPLVDNKVVIQPLEWTQ